MAEPEVIQVTGRVDALPGAVWDYLCDPGRMVRLNPDLIEMRGLDPPGPLHTGQRWVERSRTPLGEQELQTRVVEVEHPQWRIRLESRGPIGTRIQGSLQLSPADAGTQVTLEHHLTLPGGPLVSGAAMALLAGRVRQGSEAALARLAEGVKQLR